MQNKHLSHPEDEILTGNLDAIRCLLASHSRISLKIDGSPAIVWGTDPATGTFFVGTKSVFNKKKIMIAHNHDEIDQMYPYRVANILHICFNVLPRTDRIIQGDFIGFANGGRDTFQPNTLTYKFAEPPTELVIVAPHTEYESNTTLRDAQVVPYTDEVQSTKKCKFVHAIVDRLPCSGSFPEINECDYDFLTTKEAAETYKTINRRIANGGDLNIDFLTYNLGYDLAELYQDVIDLKNEVMSQMIVYSEISVVNGEHEGFVIQNEYGMVKLVNRHEFSRLNFTVRAR